MEILKVLNWRYATKAMNGKKVEKDKLNAILQSINLAPTSLGLQPFNVLLIEKQELKEKILPIANGQKQVVDCSYLLIFAAWSEFTDERKQEFYTNFEKVRGSVPDVLKNYIETVYDNAQKNPEEFFNWAARQTYLAFGVGIVAAADMGVDSTPMEGFNPQELDKLLNLNEKKLKSVLLLPLGHRDVAKDYLVNLPKLRKPLEQLVIPL
ncbi:MAG TPA: NAD(P)H-dependent oxidoreductase [Ignavibacteriales bacterium]|jgi:nitroreductase|nr:NAD(P)H-dependent oxidoreductase [Ignavibacteriales bacterium]